MTDDSIIVHKGEVIVVGPDLTPWEDEIIKCISEECSEIIKDGCKAGRFGDCTIPGDTVTNLQHLSYEAGNLVATLRIASETGMIDIDQFSQGYIDKLEKLPAFLRTKPPYGWSVDDLCRVCRTDVDEFVNAIYPST